MATITLAGGDAAVEAPVGTSLLEALQGAGLPIATSCGGVATCALCRVTVTEGRELLSPLNERELLHLGSIAKIVGLRLACQARVASDGALRVDVPPLEDVAAKKAAKAQRLRASRAGSRR